MQLDTARTFTLDISVKGLLLRFRWCIALTIFLVLAESILILLFPLFIGNAINGLLEDSATELVYLGGLGLLALIIGSSRRFYDTRIYAGIYATIATEMVDREQRRDSPLSTISARANLLTEFVEFVEFLENSMPMIVTSIIGIVGVLLIILTLNTAVFLAALTLFVLMVLIYLITGKINFRLNRNFNDELEKQVDVLSDQQIAPIRNHFKTLMGWNIRLSDLETFNYAIIWLGIIALLVYAPLVVIDSGTINFGEVFAILTYVFDYIENLIMLPLFIQQIIRLQEISSRLRA